MDRPDARRLGSLDGAFVCRQAEIDWLFDRFRRGRYQEAVVIACPPGIGKTTLAHHYVAQVRTSREPPILASGYEPKEALARIDSWIENNSVTGIHLRSSCDDADAFDEGQLNVITGAQLGLGVVRGDPPALVVEQRSAVQLDH